MRWSLDELYTSFDSKEYKEDFKRLESLIEKIVENYSNLKDIEDKTLLIESYIKDTSKLFSYFRKLSAFSSLTSAVDADNDIALKEMDRLSNLNTQLTKPETEFQIFIRDIDDLDEIISTSNFLEDFEFYLHEIKKTSQYMLSPKEEILISKMTRTGSSSWSQLQNKLSSTLLVDIELAGKAKQLPLPAVRNLAFDSDKAIRKKAYQAELEAYKKIEESSAAALNGIKGEVITLTTLRGYKDPLHETLVKSKMEKETLDAMIESMTDFLPVFHKYLDAKARYLGYNEGLPFYELFAPLGSSSSKLSYDEAASYIVDNFRSFSDELADYADLAFKNSWIDVEPRPGKRGGAFCSNIHPIGESRILANFDGSFSNTITLAHELGHGYHGHILKDEDILNTSYPMPIAETASIFCETIVTNAALKNASREEQLSILESSISDATQVIVDIYSRFIFESNFFKMREESKLSLEEINNLMLEAQKEAYGRGLDHETLHPYMWINKSHYYSAGRNFYNFPYAFGLLFAKGLYAKYLEEGDSFIESYDELLRQTGKKSIEDLASLAGIDVKDPNFFKSSLELIEADIDKFIHILD